MAGLWLWVRAQWRHRWASLALLGLLVALVGGVTVGVAIAARRADTALSRFMAATNQPNAEVELADARQATPAELAALPAPSDLVDRFAGLPGVRGLTAVSYIGAAAGRAGEPAAPDASYFAISKTAEWGQSMRFRFVQGRAADPADPLEVVVNEAAPAFWGVEPGDTITLSTLAPDQIEKFVNFIRDEPQGPRIDVRVVGVFRDLEDITDFPEPVVVTTPAFLERYGDEVLNLPAAVWVNAEPGDIDRVVGDLQAAAPAAFRAGVVDEDFAGRVREVISVEVTALEVFAAAAAAAGLVVLFQALGRHLAGESDALRVGRALGLRRRQLLAGSVVSVLPVVVFGLVGSAVVAVAVSAVVPRGVARRADPQPGLHVDWPGMALGSVVAALVLVGVAALAALLVVRRSGPPRSSGAVPSPMAMRHLPNRLPMPMALGVRYALGGGRGTRWVGWAGLAGAAVGVAGIVAVATVTRSANTLLDSPALWGATWDAQATIEDDVEVTGAVERLATDPDVEAVALLQFIDDADAVSGVGPAGRTSVQPLALQPVKGDMRPVVTEGRRPIGPDEAAVGSAMADLLGVEPGDSFELRTRRHNERFTMVGTLVFPGNDELGNAIVVTPDGLDSLRGGCPVDSDEGSCAVRAHDVGVRFRAGVDVDDATARLAAEDPALHRPDPPSEVNNLDQMGVTPWLLAGFMAMLGLAGLAHALVVGCRRQRHDLAVVRALGLRPGQAGAVVRWQGIVLTGIGACAGVLVGALAGRLVWQGVADSIGAVVDVELSPWLVVVLPPLAVLIGLAAALIPAHHMARQRPAQVLRSE